MFFSDARFRARGVWRGLVFFSQGEDKLQSAVQVVLGHDGSAVNLHTVLDDGQSESGSAKLARASLVDTVESLEQPSQVLGSHANPGVGKAEVVHAFVLAEARHPDGDARAGIGDGVVGEVSEDGVDERVVALYFKVGLQLVFDGDVLFFELEGFLVQDVGHDLRDVHLFHVHLPLSVVHAVEQRNIVQQGAQSVALGIAAREELAASFEVHVGIFDEGLEVALNAAHGGFELVSDVLRELPFQASLLFVEGDVVDRDFEAEVFKDDALHPKDVGVFLNSDRPAFLFGDGALCFVVDKIVDVAKLLDGKDVFGGFQVGVRDEVAVLGKEAVYQDFFLVARKYAQSLVRSLQVSNEFLAFDVERLLGFAQPVINLDNVIRNLFELVVREQLVGVDFDGFVLVGARGEVLQPRDQSANAVGKDVDDHDEHQGDERGEVDELAVGGEVLDQVDRVGHGRADDELLVGVKGGDVEVGDARGFGRAPEVVAAAVAQGFLNLGPVEMIGQMRFFRHALEEHLALGVDNGDTHALVGKLAHQTGKVFGAGAVGKMAQFLVQTVVVVVKLHLEQFNLEVFLTVVLVHHEGGGKRHKEHHDRDEEGTPYRPETFSNHHRSIDSKQ